MVMMVVLEWEGRLEFFCISFHQSIGLRVCPNQFQVKSFTYHFFRLGRNLFFLVVSHLCSLSQ